MKYYGDINDPKDLTTKEYVDSRVSNPFVLSSTPPSDITKIWNKNGIPYYFDPTSNAWKSFKFTTDIDVVPINSQED